MDFSNLLDDLDQLQRTIGAVAADYLWIDSTARTMVRSGTDLSGSVRTTLDENNFPQRFTISRDWQALLAGQRLDAAIVEAFGAAYADGWKKASSEVEAARRRGEQPPVPAPASEGFSTDSSVEDIIEDILAIASAPLVSSSGGAESPALRGRIVFQFSEYGLVGCRIDQDWAERRGASQIATEVNTELETQRNRYLAGEAAVIETDHLATAATQLISLLHRNDFLGGY